MIKISGILATTETDSHGEKLSLKNLETMVSQINRNILLINDEHDPRNPPNGRILSAKIVPAENNEFNVEFVGEIFELSSITYSDIGNREIVQRKIVPDKFTIISDRGFENTEDQQLVNDLCNILRTDSKKFNLKKALDPITILYIAGAFVIGNIANGFIGAIGTDAYNALKQKLKEIAEKKKKEKFKFLLDFNFYTHINDKLIDIEIILSNPYDSEINSFLDDDIILIDQMVMDIFDKNCNIRKIVFEYAERKFTLKYVVDNKGISDPIGEYDKKKYQLSYEGVF